MHEEVFDPLPVRIQLQRRGLMASSLELFRKFYAAEEYSEVAKMFRRVYTQTMEGENDFLEVSWPCAWNFPLKIFEYN